MIKLKINVTNEILQKSAGCTGFGKDTFGTNCAIALAIRDIFPFAHVCKTCIDTDFYLRNPDRQGQTENHISLPSEAIIFIDEFDFGSPDNRLRMSPISFEIEISDEVLEKINIDEIKPLLKNHPTLKLVE